jgi:hypothetical protein
MPSEYRVAGIDVHKKMLAVVISDVAGELILSFVPAAEQRLWRTADTRAPPVDLRPGAAAEPTGSLAGRCADQTEQLCQRPAWIKQPPHPAGPRTRRKRPSGVGHPGRAGVCGPPQNSYECLSETRSSAACVAPKSIRVRPAAWEVADVQENALRRGKVSLASSSR